MCLIICFREYIVGVPPALVKATSSYSVEGRLSIEQNDTIAIIDGRTDLKFLKGQNQRTYEIGTFPRHVLEVLRLSKNGTLSNISRPLHESFRHTGHGSAFGSNWGNPGFLDPSYLGQEVQLRDKSNGI